MFTGIVEEMGQVTDRIQGDGFDSLTIAARTIMSDLAVGHSIAVNGVCLTVVDKSEPSFTVQVIPETLEKSSLGDLSPGSWVNLERALRPADRFHGHVVQGHVETVAYIDHIATDRGDVRMTVAVDPEWLRYCVPKGSIALDGVSLTLTDVSPAGLTVALIPYTLAHTTLGKKQTGDPVNVETDILVRYLERFLEMENGAEVWHPDLDKLRSWGFGES
ncbi:MAG: riboflavin synthase [Fidelibacterota bacterium]|nr:MAG: riboflavin synthase [Candidatus Neomarinimicrobiota bacterium]